MKRLLFIICLVTFIAGCSNNFEQPVSPIPTPNPTPGHTPIPIPPSPSGEGSLIWNIEPTLYYDMISYYPNFGFIAYTSDYKMYYLDEKTAEVIEETYPTGGFRDPYTYGYDAASETFLYNEEYEYIPEKSQTVIEKSKDKVISVYELAINQGNYEWKDDGKCAVYYNGRFITDFEYDWVIGGNNVALVSLNGLYAIVGNDGNQITDFIFDNVSENAPGYIAVEVDGNWGFVDINGNEVIQFIFEDAENIDEDTAFVKYNGKYGILNVKETVITDH